MGTFPSIKSVRPSFIYPVAQSTYPTPHVRHVISATSEPKTENVAQPRTKLTTAVPPTAPMALASSAVMVSTGVILIATETKSMDV